MRRATTAALIWTAAAACAGVWCVAARDATPLAAGGLALALRGLLARRSREELGARHASRAENVQSEPHDAEFDLPGTLEQVRTRFAPAAVERGISLTCEVAPRLPRMVRGDDHRLREVLAGLISNAVKFTKAGGVAVRAVADHDDGQTLRLCVSVSDTGPGVPQDGMLRLFQTFSESTPAAVTTRKPSSLENCKRLVETMGGQIAVASEPGRGATFWFTLVVHRVAQDQDAEHAGPLDLRSAKLWAPGAGAEAEALRELVRELGLNLIDDPDVGRAAGDIVLLALPNVAAACEASATAEVRTLNRPGVIAAIGEHVETPEQARALREAGIDAWVQLPVDEAHLADALALVCGSCGRQAVSKAA